MKKHIDYLNKLRACGDAVEYADGFKSMQDVWGNCERGDWMLWLLGEQAGKPGTKSRKKLVLTACKCARLALKYVPKGEKRPLKAIQAAEKYAKGIGNVSLQDVRAAVAAAVAVAVADADAAYAAAAAAAAAYAADAAYAAADAAYAAADAAAAARADALKQCAAIVRQHFPDVREVLP